MPYPETTKFDASILIVSLVCILALGLMLGAGCERKELQKLAVEHKCAEFDKEDGEFGWVVFDKERGYARKQLDSIIGN